MKSISKTVLAKKAIKLAAACTLLLIAVGCNSKESADVPEKQPAPKQDPVAKIARPKLPDVKPTISEKAIPDMDQGELVECLGEADLQRRLAVTEHLVESGPDCIPSLVTALKSENYHVRAGAAFALGQFGKTASSAHDALVELSTQDPREAVRSAAAFAADAIAAK